jgi:hypothetical protein
MMRICVLDFAKVGDHLCNYLHDTVSDILIFREEAFEKMLQKTRDEARRRGIFVLIFAAFFLRSYELTPFNRVSMQDNCRAPFSFMNRT